MKDNNFIHIQGRIGNDLVLETSKNGNPYIRFGVAVNRGKENPDWFDCVAFQTNANNIYNWFEKGSLISLTGSMVSDIYTTEDGRKNKRWNLQVDAFSFPESKKEKTETKKGEKQEDLSIKPEELPFY